MTPGAESVEVRFLPPPRHASRQPHFVDRGTVRFLEGGAMEITGRVDGLPSFLRRQRVLLALIVPPPLLFGGVLALLLIDQASVREILIATPIVLSIAFGGAAWVLRMRPPVCRIRFDDIGPLSVTDLYESAGGGLSGGVSSDYPLRVSFEPERRSADHPPQVAFEVDRAAAALTPLSHRP